MYEMEQFMKLILGIPQALLYYRYCVLWETFFKQLDIELIFSGHTTQKTMAIGSKLAVDENCLPYKIFLGHVEALRGRCDCVLIPRIDNYGYHDMMCERFLGLYDTVHNTFPDVPLLSYNVSVVDGQGEARAFMQMAKDLGYSALTGFRAYAKARKQQLEQEHRFYLQQKQRLAASDGIKILIAAQPYLAHDPLWNGRLTHILSELGATTFYSDECHRKTAVQAAKPIAPGLFWVMNKEAVGAIRMLESQVDGVILLTAYPCGSDALVNELVIRRIKDIPMIQIIIDEHHAEAGLQTRLESFIDMLNERKHLYA